MQTWKSREKGISGRGNCKCKGPEVAYFSDSKEASGTRATSKGENGDGSQMDNYGAF